MKTLRCVPLALALLLGTAASAFADPVQFSPTDDAYTQNGANNNNQVLRVETGGRIRNSYIKFDLSALPVMDINKVILLLTHGDDAGSGPITVSSASSNDWLEGTIDGATAPTAVSVLDTLEGAVGDGDTFEFDVSAFVTGPGVYSFVVETQSTGGDDVSFASKEWNDNPANVDNQRQGPTLVVNPVPEPTTLGLGFIALGTLLVVRRRRG